jgi:hypothetical protein
MSVCRVCTNMKIFYTSKVLKTTNIMDKRTKKKFNRGNITVMSKYDKNFEDWVASQEDNGITAIENLIIYGSKLTNESQKRFFSYDKVSRLVSQILRGNTEGIHYYSKMKNKIISKGQSVKKQDKHYDIEFNTRIVRIAAFLVREATEVCIAYYRKNHESEPELNKFVVDPIKEAAAICTIIAMQRKSSGLLIESAKIYDRLANPVVTRANENQKRVSKQPSDSHKKKVN